MLIDSFEMMGQNAIENLIVASGADFPTATTGELFFKTGVGLHVYTGSSWQSLTVVNESTGKIETGLVPAIAITDTFVVASEAAMLALVAERGDIAIRTDLNKTYVLAYDTPSVLGNWIEMLIPSASDHPYDIAFSVYGKPTASETVMRFKTPRSFILPQAQTNAQASAVTPATASTVFTVKRNAANIGTITFAPASTAGTIALTATHTFNVGDSFSVIAPVGADATLADIDVTFVGSVTQ